MREHGSAWMPMPRWWGQINKRVFNPRALRNRKWSVIHHVGRTTGTSYRTPLEAVAVDNGFVFTLVYGSQSDWVRNVLAAGTATLDHGGATVELTEPEVLDADEAFALLPPDAKRPPRLLRIGEFLVMRHAASSGTTKPMGRDDPA
jgi:deazaflavin-dependent oxidoreductase (nitroreductase family)